MHEILKDFDGSQDGRFTERFSAGSVVALSDYLAAIVVPAGLARQVSVDIENKAIIPESPRRGRPSKIETK